MSVIRIALMLTAVACVSAFGLPHHHHHHSGGDQHHHHHTGFASFKNAAHSLEERIEESAVGKEVSKADKTLNKHPIAKDVLMGAALGPAGMAAGGAYGVYEYEHNKKAKKATKSNSKGAKNKKTKGGSKSAANNAKNKKAKSNGKKSKSAKQ